MGCPVLRICSAWRLLNRPPCEVRINSAPDCDDKPSSWRKKRGFLAQCGTIHRPIHCYGSFLLKGVAGMKVRYQLRKWLISGDARGRDGDSPWPAPKCCKRPKTRPRPPPQTPPAPELDTGDNAWVLTSSALVLMMTGPGLALFYSGLVRRKTCWV